MNLKSKIQLSLIGLLCLGIAGMAGYHELVYQPEQGSRTESRGEDFQYSKGVNIARDSIEYQGKKYRYNDHLSNYLFLGIDQKTFAKTERGNADAGSSDAIYLLSVDRMSGETTMISIPRDCMTYITIFTYGDQIPHLQYDHLNIQFGYGDGQHESCNLTKNAVSSMLYGLPIQGYCALALDGLSVIPEDIDGVEVEIPDDSLEFRDAGYKKGSRVEITPDNIELFLRVRDITVDQTAIYRLNRQRIFLKAFLERAMEKYNEDPGIISELYEDMQPYILTNMSNDQFLKIFDGASSGRGITEWVVPGEGVSGGEHDEFHVDDQELLDMLVQSVCVPAEE